MIKGIKAIFEVVDRATAPIRRIGRVLGSIDLSPLRKQLGRVMDGVKGVGKAFAVMAGAAAAGVATLATGAVGILHQVADAAKEARLDAARNGEEAVYLRFEKFREGIRSR